MLPDFMSLCRTLVEEPEYLQQSSARRQFVNQYYEAFNHALADDDLQKFTSYAELTSALMALGTFRKKRMEARSYCETRLKQNGVNTSKAFDVTFELFLDACVKCGIVPHEGPIMV